MDLSFFEPSPPHEASPPPPPMKREVALSVAVYDHYQYFYQAATRFMGGGMQSNLIVFWY